MAISGGRDSVALLHVLLKLGYQISAAHCNFMLRGEESEQETKFVQELCEKLKIDCYVKYFNTRLLQKNKKESIQVIARDLRYQWLEEKRREIGAKKIITAHQLDDQFETFMINFSRGTGLKGLTGIPSERGVIVRPMLSVSRKAVTQYAKKHGISFKDDSSNDSDAYLRNKIRRHIAPYFKDFNPSFDQGFLKTLGHLKQVNAFWEQAYESWKEQIEVSADEVVFSQIAMDHDKSSGFVSYYLSTKGFSQADLNLIFNPLSPFVSGTKFYGQNYQLLFNRGNWILSVQINKKGGKYFLGASDFPIQLSSKSFVYETGIPLKTTPDMALIDKGKISGALFVKKWEHGDWFVPLGMKGKKKLSDFFIDQKYSMIDKEKTWLLCDEKSIIWIIGKRIDDRYKVNKNTREVIELHLKS